jgi:hypothetical protein
MSKKVLKLAGRQPMLLALIVMATFTIGLLFSGWLTPMPGKAQPNQQNPQPNVETTNCVTASTTTNCEAEAIVTLSNIPPIMVCLGSGVGASTTAIVVQGTNIVDVGYTNAGNSGNDQCPDTFTTNVLTPKLGTNWWTASGCGISTNGAGLSTGSTPLIPTYGGQVTITFNQKWQHICDTNTETARVAGTITVVAVASLTPNIPADEGGLEAGSDPPKFWVTTCPGGDWIVRAGSSPSLTVDQLPACWTFTGGVEIDKLTHLVNNTDLANGPVTLTVTCGTSTETIVLATDETKVTYDVHTGCSSCLDDNCADPDPLVDKCGNTLAVNCVDCSFFQYGHFEYRYNGIWVGQCFFDGGENSFLYKQTQHACHIVCTWHLTQKPVSPTFWVVTKYDCLAGGGTASHNYRTAPTWDSLWDRPADELIWPGYPANSCENQGSSVSSWPPTP